MKLSLTKEQWQQILSVVLSAVLAIAAVSGWVINPAILSSGQAAEIEARVREKISIDARDDALLYNGADLIVYSDDHSTTKATLDGATGTLAHAGFEQWTPAATVVVTNTVFTPLGTYQPISSTVAVTPTIGLTATAPAGTLLELLNVGAQNILFADSGTQTLGGARTLAANDGLLLLFDGTNWVELAFHNN